MTPRTWCSSRRRRVDCAEDERSARPCQLTAPSDSHLGEWGHPYQRPSAASTSSRRSPHPSHYSPRYVRARTCYPAFQSRSGIRGCCFARRQYGLPGRRKEGRKGDKTLSHEQDTHVLRTVAATHTHTHTEHHRGKQPQGRYWLYVRVRVRATGAALFQCFAPSRDTTSSRRLSREVPTNS